MKPGYIYAEDLAKWIGEQKEKEHYRWCEALKACDFKECDKSQGADDALNHMFDKVMDMWSASNIIAETEGEA